jgi:flagellin
MAYARKIAGACVTSGQVGKLTMSLNSVNTNLGAQIALESLNATNASLSVTEKQISTGYRVADATDDGAAYAVAQRVRSDVGALTSANNQIGNVTGLVTTTLSSLTDVSNTLNSARDVLVKLSDSGLSADQTSQYETQYSSLVSNIKNFFTDAKYNGKTLIGNIGGTAGFTHVDVVRNELGATYGIYTFGGSTLYGSISGLGNAGAGTIIGYLTAGGQFTNQLNLIGSKLNEFGSASNFLNLAVSYNNDKINALNAGLGALVDANLAQESAQLQSLQIRQQLGTQALSIANQAPQSLLSLFK